MRTRVLRGLAAVVLALAVAVPGTISPAQAAGSASDRIVTVVFSAYRLLDGGLTSSDVQQLVQAAISAVTAANDDVIAHLDAQQAAEAKAAARSASLEFADYDVIRQNPILLFMFASDVGGSATLAKEQLEVVEDPNAADQIGHALNVMYPIAMVAAEDAGMTNTRAGLMEDYIEANEYIVDQLEPACTRRPVHGTPAWIEEVHVECVAANGETAAGVEIRNISNGEWLEGPVEVEELKELAAADSSWMVAKQVLEMETP